MKSFGDNYKATAVLPHFSKKMIEDIEPKPILK